MMGSTTPLFRRSFLMIPVLATGFWLSSQKGCELTSDSSPTLALADAGPEPISQVPFPIRRGEPALDLDNQSVAPASEPKSRSLKRAIALLRQAADMLDKNERLAVQFLRQAIEILRHGFTHGIDAPDFDQVSERSGALRNGALSREFQTEFPSFLAPLCRISKLTPGTRTGDIEAHRGRCVADD